VEGANQTLVVVIDNTAQAHGLRLSRSRPNGPSGVDVTFQGVPFDVLVAWLMTLHTTYAVDVESASLSNAREQGLVNGQLSLHRL
jgi:type II secretory pathway component PulM